MAVDSIASSHQRTTTATSSSFELVGDLPITENIIAIKGNVHVDVETVTSVDDDAIGSEGPLKLLYGKGEASSFETGGTCSSTTATDADSDSAVEDSSVSSPTTNDTDAQMTSKTQRPRCCVKLLRRAAVTLVATVAVLLIVLLLGTAYEQYQIDHSPGTQHFYDTDQVCTIVRRNGAAHGLSLESANETNTADDGAASEDDNSNASFVLATEMYDKIADASSTNDTIVAHCGECGHCSTPQDIAIYDETKNTLYGDSAACAKKGIFGGYDAAYRCMEERVGLTPGCNDCWVKNMMCDRTNCIFSCAFQALFGGGIGPKTASDVLDRCTRCDEVRCGPEFVHCAGANRRRTGIISDIQRDVDDEVCCSVSPPLWWKDQALQVSWAEEQQKHQQQRDSVPQAPGTSDTIIDAGAASDIPNIRSLRGTPS